MKRFFNLKFLSVTLALASLWLAIVSPAFAAYNGVVHMGPGNVPTGQIVSNAAPLTLAQITGTSSETVVANILIPANFTTAGSRITVRTFWNFTGTAGTKTTKVYLNSSAAIGGTAYLTVAGGATDLSAYYETTIVNTTTGAQIGGVNTGVIGARATVVLPAGSIDMTANSYIVITATNASTADTAQLTGYQIEILQ